MKKDKLPTPVFLGFLSGSDSKNNLSVVWRPGFDLWVVKIPGGSHGNLLQYSCLRIPLAKEPEGLHPWCCKETDMTECLRTEGGFSALHHSERLFLFSRMMFFHDLLLTIVSSPGQVWEIFSFGNMFVEKSYKEKQKK